MKPKDETTHRIRLRGPWNVQRLSPGREGEVAVVHFPATWGAVSGGERGTYRFSRRFGSPTGVRTLDLVWLEIASSAAGRAVLNEQHLGSITPGTQSFDVTSRLHDGNQIELELRRPSGLSADEAILEAAIVIETRREPPTPPPSGMPRSP